MFDDLWQTKPSFCRMWCCPQFWLVNDWPLSLGISKEYMSRSKCSFLRKKKQLTPCWKCPCYSRPWWQQWQYILYIYNIHDHEKPEIDEKRSQVALKWQPNENCSERRKCVETSLKSKISLLLLSFALFLIPQSATCRCTNEKLMCFHTKQTGEARNYPKILVN